ncbi:hypothetical protein [Parvibaculum sp.]
MMPFYWLLISIAAYKALWQLITKPFHWEKTEHGISSMLESRFTGSDEKLASDGVH